ncbi:GAF domain-containing protein [Patulibacter minatonensis]|uniref:GAF domain-containing protein n=1 Tax=Patulibacter minatonensis TaxID=298163 RepID=UPI0004B16CA4|nr:GAF domain-containing protein [Patulibacter minatonensis]
MGIDCHEDRVGRARSLVAAHEQALAGEDPDSDVRQVVAASWRRAQEAGVDPERHHAPVTHASDEAAERWREHPLGRFGPLIRRTLGDFSHDAQRIVVVADADGCILWSAGSKGVLAAASAIEFEPGHSWDEATVGTNGVGTALAVGHPVQIFSAEHFRRRVHPWVCSGAPVRDPETHDILGVIDVSCGIRAAHPDSLSLAMTTASLVEASLRSDLAERRERARSQFFEHLQHRPSSRTALVDRRGRILAAHPRSWVFGPLVRAPGDGWVSPGGDDVLEGRPLGDGMWIVEASGAAVPRPRVRVEALGRTRAQVSINGATVELSPRRSEIVALLCMTPEGLGAGDIAEEVYGSDERRVTVRAEMSRLRRQMAGVLATQPYRLLADVSADFLDLAARVRGHGDLTADLAPGPLLPEATSPRLVALREELLAGHRGGAPLAGVS